MKMVVQQMNSLYEYRAATIDDLHSIWDKNIADNIGDNQWVVWKDGAINDSLSGRSKTFVIVHDNKPIGEGTLLFSPECGAIDGRTDLADGVTTVNVNVLRNDKHHRGKGHISKLVKMMEQYAADAGYKTITIGVEARETRNLAIYLHWGYNTFVRSEMEDDDLVLYYSKELNIK